MESCFKSTNLHSDCRLVGVVGDPRKAASCIHRRFKNCKIIYDMSHVIPIPLLFVSFHYPFTTHGSTGCVDQWVVIVAIVAKKAGNFLKY